jgi:hypothetical protein
MGGAVCALQRPQRRGPPRGDGWLGSGLAIVKRNNHSLDNQKFLRQGLTPGDLLT